jgi:indolepyruvate ferredoxin oxidoreductase alpha subunit
MNAPQAGLLLGDEAVALGALHAGISAAYSYPGTPATEVFEFVQAHAGDGVTAQWCANEKTAYEQALGVSMMGRRSLVSMKHVGLNVAADPFVNSALLDIAGGLVVAVADDPGMHSSQNEQDTRYLADFARILCLEPASRQEAYEMTREAFDLSERFSIPVVIRLVTRLCHGRSPVRQTPRRHQNPVDPNLGGSAWTLIPANARRQWRKLLDTQPALEAYSAAAEWNSIDLNDTRLGVITCGIARNYLAENIADLDEAPSHLHIGVYPPPAELLHRFAEQVERIIVLEDGYPFLERRLRGLLPPRLPIEGRDTGALPLDGELNPDLVRSALGMTPRPSSISVPDLPPRPPRLCQGCPHADSFDAVQMALGDFPESTVTADIGCYTLGALPPYEAIESCVCMGASIGMAKGAADAGARPVLAVIGDGTFLHSGLTPLLDAVAADSPMTVLILDNRTVAMTGLQPTVVPDTRLEPILLGLGVDPAHLHVLDVQPHKPDELTAVLRKELEHEGLSVVVAVRECVEAAKHRRRSGS